MPLLNCAELTSGGFAKACTLTADGLCKGMRMPHQLPLSSQPRQTLMRHA